MGRPIYTPPAAALQMALPCLGASCRRLVSRSLMPSCVACSQKAGRQQSISLWLAPGESPLARRWSAPRDADPRAGCRFGASWQAWTCWRKFRRPATKIIALRRLLRVSDACKPRRLIVLRSTAPHLQFIVSAARGVEQCSYERRV